MDPMTGAMGYGIEYTYSVMERIRMTGLGGDKMLAGPMIVSPGQECAKIKEVKASEKDFPTWGDLAKRAAIWELSRTLKGRVQLSYSAARIRNTNTSENEKMAHVGSPSCACFSW